MGRLIVNILLLAIIVGVGWFFIAPNIICWQDGGVWQFEKRVCNVGTFEIPSSDLMPQTHPVPTATKINVATLSALTLTIPNSPNTTAHLVRTGGRLVAMFAEEGNPAENTAEGLTQFSATNETGSMSLIPFVVNFGGSGSFVYVGLFEHGTSTLIHKDSILVGDRILIDKVSFERSGDVVKVVVLYKDRKATEPMVAVPAVPKKLVATIAAMKFGKGTVYDQSVSYTTTYKDLVKVELPAPKSVVTSPVKVKGVARGSWFFEASFPIVVKDEQGKEIGQGVAHADGDWMTPEYVPFTASIVFTKGAAKTGKLVLKKDNPSDLPENEDSFEIPVIF